MKVGSGFHTYALPDGSVVPQPVIYAEALGIDPPDVGAYVRRVGTLSKRPDEAPTMRALARSWERSHAKTLALELIPPTERGSAITAAPAQLGGRLPERLPELRAEQAALRETLRTYPEHVAGRLRTLEESAERAGRGAEAAEARLDALRRRLEEVRPWQRRERRELGRRAAHEEQLIARLVAEARADRAKASGGDSGRAQRSTRLASHDPPRLGSYAL